MRPSTRSLALLGPALLVAGGALLSLPQEEPFFPHEIHVDVFNSCLGCHAGIPEGEPSAYFSVTEADCLECHEPGEIAWAEPGEGGSNLKFRHAVHAEMVDMECGECHALPDGEEFMEVGAARPTTCFDCHEGESHLAAGTACATCHLPLAEATTLTASQIAGFPAPRGHERDAFIWEHGAAAGAADANCMFCHAQESCSRCHVNAGQVDAIAALPSDARVASLEAGRPGRWPLPESHERSDWATVHGAEAAEAIGGCANCHARPSCTTCHGEGAPFLASLPMPVEGGPAGVQVRALRPPGHTFAFASQHATAASLGLPNCSACHAESECADCHALRGTGQPPLPSVPSARHEPREADEAPGVAAVPSAEPAGGFHPVNFLQRHAAEAYSVRADCSSCHSTEVFCRTCHTNLGFGDDGATRGNAFHDAQPDWLLAHGQAARQGMEECASCHQQDSCLRCHSAKFGWRVSPHGSDFDPDRVADRSKISCGICHTSDILEP
jgi:hypothetical protein